MKLSEAPKILKDWWQLVVIIGLIAGFFYTLPNRLGDVEAQAEENTKQNIEQYRILDRLTYVAEQNEQIQRQQVQQQPYQPYEYWTEYNDSGQPYCIDNYGDWYWGECY